MNRECFKDWFGCYPDESKLSDEACEDLVNTLLGNSADKLILSVSNEKE